ncbi:somatostatin receptor type 2-like [Saccostrea echinata]|uniref:somatostatin receptor type 2-like n=1 Tax=Saccostrea echinata TaxID=191078 RepID=UPI002A83638E|nr:somatostatin receptor type 2-like [Saccostrea echinata]
MYLVNNTTQSECANIVTNEAVNTVFVVVYILIGVCGLFGNLLVIYVILNSPKMKTVTNMYIFNLALSDLIFLLHIAMITTTTIVKHWVFGETVCRIFFMTASVTTFSSVLTLTSLSVDRYIAVCKPVISQKHRQRLKAVFVIVFIWLLSLLLSMPIILYSKRTSHPYLEGKFSCQVDWPDVKVVPAYIIYTFILGFGIPLCFISTFYTCVILHMKSAGPVNRQRSTEQRKNHRKVTYLVFAIILTYVICWLPYWVLQIVLVVLSLYNTVIDTIAVALHICTVLTFANSMINPILYAFISENFRQRFKEAFTCQCIFKERIRYILTQGHTNTTQQVELDLVRRHASNQTDAETTRDQQDSLDRENNGGVYTGL